MQLVAQGLLVQSFFPWLPERTVQVHCWFLSAMLLFWVLFGPILRRVVLKLTSLHATCALLALLSLPPWITVLVPSLLPGIDPIWYTVHHTGHVQEPMDLLVIFLKFHPLCYLHVFVYGMVLARLRALVADELERATPSMAATTLSRIFGVGAIAGYTGLCLIFTIRDLQPTSYKLSARLSLLMPFQGLVLLGLSPITATQVGRGRPSWKAFRDPLALVFSFAPSVWGNISYSQYVLQFIAIQLWPTKNMRTSGVLFFFACLLSSAWLTATLFVRPLSKWWLRQTPRCLALQIVAISALLGIGCHLEPLALMYTSRNGRDDSLLCGIRNQASQDTQPRMPLPYVVVEAGAAIDVRLNWTSAFDELGETRALINPSLLWSPGGLLIRAARAHRKSCVVTQDEYRNQTVSNITTLWQSDIVLSYESYNSSYESRHYSYSAGFDRNRSNFDQQQGPPSPLGQLPPLYGWDVSQWKLGDAPLQIMDLTITNGHNMTYGPWGMPCKPKPHWYPHNATLLATAVTLRTQSSSSSPPALRASCSQASRRRLMIPRAVQTSISLVGFRAARV